MAAGCTAYPWWTVEQRLSLPRPGVCQGHLEGAVKRNRGRSFGLIQSFIKRAFRHVFLFAFNDYLLDNYCGPRPGLGSEPTRQRACSYEVYMAGAEEGCGETQRGVRDRE